MARKYRINIEGEERVVELVEHGEKDYLITLDGKTYQTHVEDAGGSGSEGTQPRITISSSSPPALPGRAPELKISSQTPPAADAPGSIQICASLTGTVTNVKVVPGAIVERGQVLCLMEAMKMEMEVSAPQNGVITTVAVKASDTVQQGSLLFVLHAETVN
jgi:glutaconyl-CoA/methylmalonyl-CoA decarboxylase subunit gamma